MRAFVLHLLNYIPAWFWPFAYCFFAISPFLLIAVRMYKAPFGQKWAVAYYNALLMIICWLGVAPLLALYFCFVVWVLGASKFANQMGPGIACLFFFLILYWLAVFISLILIGTIIAVINAYLPDQKDNTTLLKGVR